MSRFDFRAAGALAVACLFAAGLAVAQSPAVNQTEASDAAESKDRPADDIDEESQRHGKSDSQNDEPDFDMPWHF